VQAGLDKQPVVPPIALDCAVPTEDRHFFQVIDVEAKADIVVGHAFGAWVRLLELSLVHAKDAFKALFYVWVVCVKPRAIVLGYLNESNGVRV